MDPQVKKYVIGASVTAAICVLYMKGDVIFSVRQRWLAYLGRDKKEGGHGVGGHSHGHGHSHGQPPDAKQTVDDIKTKLFHGLNKEKVSKVLSLGNGAQGIRILEIGVGSGTNFKYFPSPCLFIAVDPNPFFEKDVADNLKMHPGVKLEQRLQCGAENMESIPSNSVDAVVATLVFCQVKDVEKTFSEIIRILVPGGKFYYLDHLASDSRSWRGLFENIITYTGLARLVFNANLKRDIGKNISSSPFRTATKEYLQHNRINFVMGVAEK